MRGRLRRKRRGSNLSNTKSVLISVAIQRGLLLNARSPHRFSGEYVINVPREMELVKIETKGGAVSAKGIAGRVEAETGGGKIHLEDIGGDVHCGNRRRQY